MRIAVMKPRFSRPCICKYAIVECMFWITLDSISIEFLGAELRQSYSEPSFFEQRRLMKSCISDIDEDLAQAARGS